MRPNLLLEGLVLALDLRLECKVETDDACVLAVDAYGTAPAITGTTQNLGQFWSELTAKGRFADLFTEARKACPAMEVAYREFLACKAAEEEQLQPTSPTRSGPSNLWRDEDESGNAP